MPSSGQDEQRVPRPDDADGQGRDRLLAATVELIFDQFDNGMPLGVVFSHITPVAIAERAGVSRGLIYHYWPGDPDSGASPMDRLVTEVLERAFDRSDEIRQRVDSAASSPVDVANIIRRLTDDGLRQMSDPGLGNAWRVRTILNLCGAPVALDVAVPVSRSASVAVAVSSTGPGTSRARTTAEDWRHEERETAFQTGLDEVHAALLHKFGLRMRPPLEIRDLTVALAAFTDGIGLGVITAGSRVLRTRPWRSAIGSEAVTEEGWTLYAIGADALIAGLTEPLDS